MAFLAELAPVVEGLFGATAATAGAEAMGAGIIGGGAADIAGVAGSGLLGGMETAGLGGLAGGLESIGSGVSNLLGGMPNLFGAGKGAAGVMSSPAGGLIQTLSGLYGFDQSRKLRNQLKPPDPRSLPGMPGYQAGLEAVQRSMASQGYQGSGNMMAALQQYGGQAYNDMWSQNINSAQAQGGMLGGELSSIGLMTGGLPKLMGWGGK